MSSSIKKDISVLISGVLSGKEMSLSHLLTILENDIDVEAEILNHLAPHLGRAYRIGITGIPGAGKSTLIDKLTACIRAVGMTVGIICVDPTSPLSGGAVLGDRIRMEQHFSDSGVFIRSMASRGNPGGMSRGVKAAVALLDAFGKDIIIVETVGIGQEETGITKIVDTTLLVLAPGWGDSMQLMKAGILEVADVIIINKADSNMQGLVDELREILALSIRKPPPNIYTTQALNNLGIEELFREIERQINSQRSGGGNV